MSHKLYIILFVFSCLMVMSCESENTATVNRASLQTSKGLSNYLKNLPAVKDIELWESPYGHGLIIRTEHYIVKTTLKEPLMLRQVPALMEAAYDSFQSHLPAPVHTDHLFLVYLFDTREQWEEFTTEFTGQQAPMYLKIKKGAYYLNGACVAYNIGRKRTFGVLTHEAWHQFNSRLFAFRLPSWLDEGIATTLETPIYDKGFFAFRPEQNLSRLGALRKTILDGNMIPLKHLIALNPGYVIDDSANVLAFYAQSYALVRFLREEEYGKRLPSYHNLLLAGLRGNWPLDSQLQEIAANRNIPLNAAFNAYVSIKLFELYIEEDIEQLEKEYFAFCNKLVYRVRLKH